MCLCIPRPPVRAALSLVALSLVALSLAAAALIFASTARAGDWPQILGPHRGGAAEGEKLPEAWPRGGPATLWKKTVGMGYAGPIVVGGKTLLFHRVDDVERLEAFHAATGESLWKADFPAKYRGGIDADKGPRCVPLAHNGAVVLFGAAGDLHCVALSDGKPRWSRAAYAELGGDEGYFGAGSAPIVAADKLWVNIGGKKGAGLAAFSLATGEVVWKGTSEAASYAAPTLAEVAGKRRLIFVTRLNVVGLDPDTAEERFRFEFGKRGPTVNAATPLVFGEHLFVSASYGVGAHLAKIAGDRVETVWANDNVLSSQYTTAVFADGHLYGVDGREDYGPGALRCVEARSGKIKWEKPEYGIAHAILAGDKILLLTTTGDVALIRANSAKYEELGRAKVSAQTTRALPALAHGKLYCRGNAGAEGELLCVEVGAK